MQDSEKKKFHLDYETRANIIRILGFIILSFCYLIFFFNQQGQPIIKADIDGQFNFSRMMGLENIWKSPINFRYFNHCASAVNLMYPWATLYPMYMLVKLTGSLVGGYYIYFFIITFATLEITYQCVRHMKQSTLPAIFASVLYTFAICRTSDIYCRVDMGEVIAMTFFPIVLLGIYQLFYEEEPHWKTLVAGMTFLVYTHVLSLVIGALLVLFFVCIRIIRRELTKKQLIALLKATGMSILLGAGFLVPMLQTMFSVKVNGPCIMNLYVDSLIPKQLLNWSLMNTADSRDVFSPVFLILIIVIILNLKEIKGFFKDVLLAAAFFTFLSTSLFPWDVFQKAFALLQFPWRFITMATLLFPVAATELIKAYQTNHSMNKSVRVIGVLLFGALLAHWGAMTGVNQGNGYHVGMNSQGYISAITHNANFNGLGDYYPAISNNDAGYISNQMVCVNQQWGKVKDKMVGPDKMVFDINSNGETKAILPVYVFPGEKVIQNGVSQAPKAAKADGATQVNLVDGQNKIEISYGYSILARIAWVVSLIVFLVFNGSMLYKKYRKQE